MSGCGIVKFRVSPVFFAFSVTFEVPERKSQQQKKLTTERDTIKRSHHKFEN